VWDRSRNLCTRQLRLQQVVMVLSSVNLAYLAAQCQTSPQQSTAASAEDSGASIGGCRPQRMRTNGQSWGDIPRDKAHDGSSSPRGGMRRPVRTELDSIATTKHGNSTRFFQFVLRSLDVQLTARCAGFRARAHLRCSQKSRVAHRTDGTSLRLSLSARGSLMRLLAHSNVALRSALI
jgi:hypothetical protein